jgi:hypothetical protein
MIFPKLPPPIAQRHQDLNVANPSARTLRCLIHRLRSFPGSRVWDIHRISHLQSRIAVFLLFDGLEEPSRALNLVSFLRNWGAHRIDIIGFPSSERLGWTSGSRATITIPQVGSWVCLRFVLSSRFRESAQINQAG